MHAIDSDDVEESIDTSSGIGTLRRSKALIASQQRRMIGNAFSPSSGSIWPVLAVATALLFTSPAAQATTTTISDTTHDIAYQGLSPTGWFGGSDQGDVIGTDFGTTQIVVTRTGSAGALNVDFKIYTQFSGTECFGSTCAYYADLFLRNPSEGYSSAPFNYAIPLGYQTPNGGLSTPGLYTVSSDLASQDIWGTRTGFIYGGEYVPHGAPSPVEIAPTVLTGGTLITGATVTSTPVSGAKESPNRWTKLSIVRVFLV